MTDSWYLITVKPRQENRAIEHLNNQSINNYAPKISIQKTVKGKVSTIEEPLFPGYVFVELDAESIGWSTMRSTRGVRDFVRLARAPAKVPNQLIEALKVQYSSETTLVLSQLPVKGEPVTIVSGSFSGLEATFHQLNGEERAIVLLDILGKEQKLNISLKELAVS